MIRFLQFVTICLLQISLYAQWQQLPGPYGSEIYTIAITDNQLFAGKNAFYATVPGTEKWVTRHSAFNSGSDIISSSCIAGSRVFFSSQGGLIYTDDYGYSYNYINGIPPGGGSANGTFAKYGDTIYYKQNGVYRSVDNGLNWIKVNNDNYLSTALGYDGYRLYLSYGNSIVTSVNKGVTFQAFSPSLYQTYGTIYVFHLLGTKFYLGGLKGLGVTTDNGNTWTRLGIGAFDSVTVRGISSGNGLLFVATDSTLYYSQDSGSVWVRTTGSFVGTKIKYLTVKDSLIAIATELGVNISVDTGKTFRYINKNMPGLQCGAISETLDKLYVYETNQFSADGGATWQKSNIDSLSFLLIDNDGSNLFAVANTVSDTRSSIYFSSNNGITWQKRSNGIPQQPFGGTAFRDIKIIKDKVYAANVNAGLYVSSDTGKNWQLDNAGLSGQSMSVYQIVEVDTNIFRASAYGLYKKVNGTWQSITALAAGSYNAVKVDSNVVIAGGGTSLFKSLDFGNTWSSVALPPSQTVLTAELADGKIFIGTFNGVFVTRVDTTEWSNGSYGLVPKTIVSLYSDGEYIYGGTNSHGLWKRLLSEFDKRTYISGTVYSDDNNNLSIDSNELRLSNVLVKAGVCNYITNTDANGFYSFILDCGSTVVSIATLPKYTNTVTPQQHILTTNDSTANFALRRDVGINDLTLDIDGMVPARPGHGVSAYITVFNSGTTRLAGSVTVSVIDTANLKFNSSSDQPVIIPQDTMIWTIDTLAPNTQKVISVVFDVDSQAITGKPVNLYGRVTPIIGDADTLDNYAVKIAQVVQSLDPNFKEVIPSGDIVQEFIDSANYLTYILHFQNTGNYPAYNIVIKDTLDENLNLETFEFISSSHPSTYSLKNRELVFYFNDIMLPDSISDEPNSHGFAKYRIKPKAISLGDKITNTCHIIFDLNEPLQTNTVETELIEIVSIMNNVNDGEETIKLFPNPVRDKLHVDIKGGMHKSYTTTIIDYTGRCVMKEYYDAAKGYIDVSKLSRGVYVLSVTGNDFTGLQSKFIISK